MRVAIAFLLCATIPVMVCSAVPLQANPFGVSALVNALTELKSIAQGERNEDVTPIIATLQQALAYAQANMPKTSPPELSRTFVNLEPDTVPYEGKYLALDDAASALKIALDQLRVAGTRRDPVFWTRSITAIEKALTQMESVRSKWIASGGASPISDAARWGEPTEGIQLRLGLSKSAQPQFTDAVLPQLQVQIRNLGNDVVKYVIDSIDEGSQIEIDGIWYSPAFWTRSGSSDPTPREVVPGAQDFLLGFPGFQTSNLLEVDRKGTGAQGVFPKLEIQPGKHTIRVRTSAVGDEGGRASTHQGIPLASNAIIIEISSTPRQQTFLDEISALGPLLQPTMRWLVESNPDTAIEVINDGIRVAENEFACGELVSLIDGLHGEGASSFLRSKLSAGVGVPSQVAAAKILFKRGQPEAIPAMIDAWRNIQPRLPQNQAEPTHADCNRALPEQRRLNEATAYREAGGIITFLAESGNAEAIEALGHDLQRAPIDVRLAVVSVFKPSANGGGSWTGETVAVNPDMPILPGGAAGAAIERLLVTSLDDTQPRLGMKGNWKDVSWENPRICDIAAFILSLRWPEKYRFVWSVNVAENDAQIASLRNK